MDKTSRSLRQEELNGVHRTYFVDKVLSHLDNNMQVVRFVACKKHNNLVVIKKENVGEWSMSVADEHWYTYRLSNVIELLEKIYDSGATIMCLKGEVELDVRHVKANADAEESQDHGWGIPEKESDGSRTGLLTKI